MFDFLKYFWNINFQFLKLEGIKMADISLLLARQPMDILGSCSNCNPQW